MAKKNKENTKNWWNFKKIWDIKTNLDKLIALITLKMYINKILYLLSFICFYFMWICFVIFELWHFKVLVCENYQYKGTLLNTCAWNSQEKHCSFSQTLILITEKGLKFKLWVSSGIVKTGSTGVSFENSTSNLSRWNFHMLFLQYPRKSHIHKPPSPFPLFGFFSGIAQYL